MRPSEARLEGSLFYFTAECLNWEESAESSCIWTVYGRVWMYMGPAVSRGGRKGTKVFYIFLTLCWAIASLVLYKGYRYPLARAIATPPWETICFCWRFITGILIFIFGLFMLTS